LVETMMDLAIIYDPQLIISTHKARTPAVAMKPPSQRCTRIENSFTESILYCNISIDYESEVISPR